MADSGRNSELLPRGPARLVDQRTDAGAGERVRFMFSRGGRGVAAVPRAWLPAVLVLISLLAGCRSGKRTLEPDPGLASTSSATVSTADWLGMPLSWEKLDNIEAWLRSSAAAADDRSRVRAELELAEGRLYYAQVEEGRAAAAVITLRRGKAERGFQGVLRDPAASESDRGRAQRGLNALGSVPPVATQVEPSGGLKIQSRALWAAAPPAPSRLTRNEGAWTRITVHHSGPPDENLSSDATEAKDIIRRIQKHHMENNKWGDIGYHYLVTPAGVVFAGRSLQWQGAHAGHNSSHSNNNPHNIGICMLGDFQSGTPTEAALRSLRSLIDQLRAEHRIARANVFRHNQLTASVCPGPVLAKWVDRYRATADSISRHAAEIQNASAGRRAASGGVQ